jgi:hypothetical protein
MSLPMMDLFEIYVLEHPEEEQRTKVDAVPGEDDPDVWVEAETVYRFMDWLVKHKHMSKAYRDQFVSGMKKAFTDAKT